MYERALEIVWQACCRPCRNDGYVHIKPRLCVFRHITNCEVFAKCATCGCVCAVWLSVCPVAESVVWLSVRRVEECAPCG